MRRTCVWSTKYVVLCEERIQCGIFRVVHIGSTVALSEYVKVWWPELQQKWKLKWIHVSITTVNMSLDFWVRKKVFFGACPVLCTQKENPISASFSSHDVFRMSKTTSCTPLTHAGSVFIAAPCSLVFVDSKTWRNLAVFRRTNKHFRHTRREWYSNVCASSMQFLSVRIRVWTASDVLCEMKYHYERN